MVAVDSQTFILVSYQAIRQLSAAGRDARLTESDESALLFVPELQAGCAEPIDQCEFGD